jgi:predicted RNase H-like HicB family nuclease
LCASFIYFSNAQKEALVNAKAAESLWLDTAKEFGDPIPEPKGRRLVFA